MLTTENRPQLTSNIAQGEIQFYDNFQPALSSGDYVIEIEQAIKDDSLNKTFKRSQDFVVSGNRFRLSMQAIQSVYPPIDGEGQFENILPQVILNNPSLPWEGSEDGETPRLALLVFEEGELEIKDWTKVSRTGAKSVKIESITQPEKGFAKPDLIAFSYEKEENNCLCIEISADYFNTILPRFEELKYLTHVREVNTDSKTTEQTNNWFSTVFANRLPKSNARNIVHLVSLDGFLDSLKPRSLAIENNQKVRLVSLASWEFYCEKEKKEEFEKITRKLVKNHEMLRLIPTQPIDNQTIKMAFEGGYIPLKYETRQGENTTAWYRGPLTPVIISNENFAPNFSAESAMIFDKNNGIFDTSYAVAWQTGRLLGLADRYFCKTLLDWKQQTNRFLDNFFAKKELYQKIVAIYNEQVDEAGKITFEDLMSANFSNKLLANAFSSLNDLGLVSRGNLGKKRTTQDLIQKAIEELQGFAGILDETDFETIKNAEDVNEALIQYLFET
jgi:hypothetical protein